MATFSHNQTHFNSQEMDLIENKSRRVTETHRDEHGQTIGYWLESVYGDTTYLTQQELDQLNLNLKLKEDGEKHHQ
jgi:hypothetical protein